MVEELDENQKVVWSYGLTEGLEHPLAAQRLTNGNTLIGDAKLGRVIEVTPAKQIVWNYQSADLANMRMRNAHRTDAGTTLIAIEAEAKLIEIDASEKIVWTWQAPNGAERRLYQGRRLPNGNTVMSLFNPGELVEVSPSGAVVRSIGGAHKDIQNGLGIWLRNLTGRLDVNLGLHWAPLTSRRCCR